MFFSSFFFFLHLPSTISLSSHVGAPLTTSAVIAELSVSGLSLFVLPPLRCWFLEVLLFCSSSNHFSSEPLLVHSEHAESKLSFYRRKLSDTGGPKTAIKRDRCPPALFWNFFVCWVWFVYVFFFLPPPRVKVWELVLSLLILVSGFFPVSCGLYRSCSYNTGLHNLVSLSQRRFVVSDESHDSHLRHNYCRFTVSNPWLGHGNDVKRSPSRNLMSSSLRFWH